MLASLLSSRRACALLCLGLSAACSLSAATYRSIWGDNTWSVQDTNPWTMTNSGYTITPTLKGTPYDAWRSPSQRYGSTGAAIGLQFNPTGDSTIADNPADKLHYGICQLNQSYSLRNGGTKAVGFAVLLPSNFPAPVMQTSTVTTNVNITQFWQGLRPPVSVNLINDGNGNLKWQTWIMNEDSGGGNSDTPIVANTSNISRNAWQRFVVEVKMNYGGGGYVKVWQNGSLVVNWSGKVGYRKGFTNSGGGVAGDNCSVDIGLYRNHGQQNTMQAFFDDGRYGDVYADVDP
jgi:Polysaccharide lyase